MAGTKQKSNSAVAAHERLNEYVTKGADTLKKTATAEANESGKTFLKQLLGLEIGGASKKSEHAKPKQEEAKPYTGGIVELFNAAMHTEKKTSNEKSSHVEAAMNHSRDVIKSSERASKGEVREIKQNIQEIKAELNKLLASSKVLEMEFAEVSMEQAPVDAGEYHKTFFDWMLLVIRQARHKVEDSGAWLNTVKGKGKGKDGYWGMSKKHGTSFSMSNERSVATQVG